MNTLAESSIHLRQPKDFGRYIEVPVIGTLLDAVRRTYSALVLDYAEGLDLNQWRPGLNIKSAKQQGMRFIFTKATEGTHFYDPTYEDYRDQTKAVYLPFGAFHYLRLNADPYEQAKWFYDHVGDDIDLLPILDVEKYNNQGIMSQAEAAVHILATLEAIRELFGRDVMIYTNRDSWTVLTGNASFIADFPLWVANWTNASQPTLPIGATDWVFWQYTNSYSIEGAPHAGYDANRFHGNEGAFEDYVKSLNGEPSPCECCEELRQRIEILELEIEKLENSVDKNASEIFALKERVTEVEVSDKEQNEKLKEYLERLKKLEARDAAVAEVYCEES
ncbi:hypothetical protein AC477_01100 [miscellaneous Crenarchaeota group-1 archaeon SG8-32-1]|uniref:Lysozyme n=1 Tax=miscellaneous Crenarchaeota group-1 archaeon SG8-32-1 TaxID=1685124 RepID=A0A0M0BYV9_9ARCH|nr:MAG: hypothetical protein AC477_01100 [miscellaneous Crenarchaeota group-1 archaeon SG8-32-1]